GVQTCALPISTTAIFFALSFTVILDKSISSNFITPLVGFKFLYKHFRNVDFPLPFGPIIPINSLSLTSIFIPFSISFLPIFTLISSVFICISFYLQNHRYFLSLTI